jgi:hypothetical protein
MDFKEAKAQNTLMENKLKVARLYNEFLVYESALAETAPFYDPNSGIKKNDYIKNVIKYLKEILVQCRSIEVKFDVKKIRGALTDIIQEESTLEEINLEGSTPDISGLNLQNQVILLRHSPNLSQDLRISEFIKNDLEHSHVAKRQMSILSTLMSTCYHSIHKVDVSTYYFEVLQRMSLRFLYEFKQVYSYLKEWVSESITQEKGVKSTSQVQALLTGKNTPQDLLHISHMESTPFRIQQENQKKRKKMPTQSPELNIDIPGFSGSISLQKYIHLLQLVLV